MTETPRPTARPLSVADEIERRSTAYTRTRPNLSSSLVGVAIAVALVPPLGAVGLMLEEERWRLAQGAFTLFAANLVGITLSVAVVLIVTRFVPLPLPRFGRRGLGLAAGIAGVAVATAAVMVPLTIAYRNVVASSSIQTDVYVQAATTAADTTRSAKSISTEPIRPSTLLTRRSRPARQNSRPT